MGKKSSSGTTTGYKYSMGILMGLCRGPVDAIHKIKADDQYIWEGYVDTNQTQDINAPDAFGGDDKEGGVVGPIEFYMGTPAQDLIMSGARSLIGASMSFLRGVTTVWFNGQICSNNPYPKAWSFRVHRALKGWQDDAVWYPEEAIIFLYDQPGGNAIWAMNPAHIIYECLTNRVWGRGLPVSSIDQPTFLSAANTLCREQFGLCLKWTKSTDLGDFVQYVIDHIGAALYVDRQTGLYKLKLLREDYDPDELATFDYNSGMLKIEDDDSTAVDNSHSEVVVNWVDPITNSDRQTRYQNLAGTIANQTLASTSVDYKGVPTMALAARLAQRDCMAQGSGIKRFKITFDRRGRKIAPGGVFKIHVPNRDIDGMVLRAGMIEEGPITEQTITVTAIQDVFGLQLTSYVKQEPKQWAPPDRTAHAVTVREIGEINYRDTVRYLSAADLAQVPVDSGDVTSMAKQPTPLSGDYILATHGVGEEYANHNAFPWTPSALLSNDIGIYTTTLTLADADDLNSVAVGSVAFIDNECVVVQAINPTTLVLTIGRGSVDSIPVGHLAAVRMWFPELGIGADQREYTTGEVVKVKLLTRTNSARLALADAPEDTATIIGRQGRPYPPGDVRVNGTRFGDSPNVITLDATISWAHRDRITQADHPLVHEDASTGPEAGTTYTLRFYEGVTLKRTETGITADNFVYTSTMFATDAFTGKVVTLEIESVRAGLVSWQKYHFTFLMNYGAGFDFNFDNDFDGALVGGFGHAFGEHFGE